MVKYTSEVSAIKEETISNIQRLVRIGSVRDEENPVLGGPFGIGIKNCLDEFIALCDEIGMRTFKDPDGYYGYAEVGNVESKEMIGIIGHLDVVPTGETKQWTKALPFSADIVDDEIIGRGTLDDKGPIVLNLMAIKILLASKIDINKRIRVIVGTAEETTWQGINKYKEKEESPTISYSPDAAFPVIYAEKTIIRSDISAGNDGLDFSLICKGAYNAVADKALYTGNKTKELCIELDRLEFEYEVISDKSVETIGKSAHSMECFKGINALTRMAIALENIGETSKTIKFIANYIALETNGFTLFGEQKEEVSGELTCNIGLCTIQSGSENFGIDMRIPVLCDEVEIENLLKKKCLDASINYHNSKISEKLYVEKDSALVSTLYKTYQDVTGDVTTPLQTSGGGTYARAFDNCVAFGTVFTSEGMKDMMHQPNESFEIKYITPALTIYVNALDRLLLG